jgi:hypothetical protein
VCRAGHVPAIVSTLVLARAALAVLISWLCWLAPVLPAHAEPKLVHLPLLVHMARENDDDVAPKAFVELQVRRANEIFAPHGLAFDLVAIAHSGTAARMETRADRSALEAYARDGVINCFVVASLRDVDEPERMRRGVHWHSETRPFFARAPEPALRPAHYVILSAISEPDVLAHELGHYLGNPRHSETPGNLMSYQRTEGLPMLDEAQQRRVQRAVRAYLRTGELKPGG